MRKIIAIALVLCFCLSIPAFAAKKVYSWGNVNDAGEQLVTAVDTNLMESDKHRIVGISVIDRSGTVAGGSGSEAFCSIEDAVYNYDGNGNTTGEIIAENETTNGSSTVWFLYPISIQTQLKIHQGAYTEVLVYYVER